MSEAYKLATISIGDTIIYRSDTDRRVTGEVIGWKTTPGSNQRYVLVAGGARQLTLDKVLARRRLWGDGKGIIQFEELNEQKGHDYV